MKRLSKDELAVILSEHAKWTADSATGKRAEIREYEITNESLPGGVILRDCKVSGGTVRGCTLTGGTVSDCTVRGCSLSGCSLSDCSVRGCTLTGGTVRGCSLSDCWLSDCSVRGCSLSGGTVSDKPLSSLKGYSGLYRYNVWAVLFKDGSRWVRMGCLFKSLGQWDAEGGIRNSNLSEFPNDGSDKCEERVAAFEFAKAAALRMKA